MFNKKYIMVKVIKEQNSYSIRKAIRINPDKPIYKGITIDIQNPTFTKKLKSFFYVDAKGNQLSFGKVNPNNTDAKVIDDMLAGKVIADLTKDMTGKDIKQKIFDIITGALLGGLTSFIIAGFVFGGFVI